MNKKILLCIPFFYKMERLEYLKKVLDEYLYNYVDYDMTIVIDTNKKKLKDVIFMCYNDKYNIIINVHDNLEHNYLLTWQHRNYMCKYKDDFDIFIYSEDDMLIPYINFVDYMDKFDALWEQNCIPNFIRVEEYNGVLYNPDNLYSTKIKAAYSVQNKLYYGLNNPHDAFWIMPKNAFNESIDLFNIDKPTLNCSTGGFDCDLRTRIANYPIMALGKTALVEITQNLQIAKTCYAYHLPNNYACVNADIEGKCGNMRVTNLLERED